jgi:hypothetical protein
VHDDKEMLSGMSDLEKLTKDVASAVRAAAPLVEAVRRGAPALAQQLERDNGPELANLGRQAERVLLGPEGGQGAILRGATVDADVVGGRLLRAGEGVDRLRQDLDRAAKHLQTGARSRAELVDALGAETPETKKLGDRLTDLSGAVQAASGTLAGAEGNIHQARGSARRLMDSDLGAGREEVAGRIRAAHTGVRQGADGLGVTLGRAGATLDKVEAVGKAATKESEALAKAGEDGTLAKTAADAALAKTTHAAANPTPKAQQVASGSASRASSPANRPGGPTQERGL